MVTHNLVQAIETRLRQAILENSMKLGMGGVKDWADYRFVVGENRAYEQSIIGLREEAKKYMESDDD